MKIKFRVYGCEHVTPIEYYTEWITELAKAIIGAGRDWNCFLKEVGFEIVETIKEG